MIEPEFIKNILSDDVDDKLYLGIDVGSVSTKCAIINDANQFSQSTNQHALVFFHILAPSLETGDFLIYQSDTRY